MPQIPGDLIYAITTDGNGTVMLCDSEGRILAQRKLETESDAEFRIAVTSMIQKLGDD